MDKNLKATVNVTHLEKKIIDVTKANASNICFQILYYKDHTMFR